jgi:hypothetical protein
VFESELQQIDRQLKAADHEQRQLLQSALKGFPESQVEDENRRINKARETLQRRRAEHDAQIKASQDAIINIPKLQHAIQLMQQQIKDQDFAMKQDFMESMGITVWIDGENVNITGVLDPNLGCNVHTAS